MIESYNRIQEDIEKKPENSSNIDNNIKIYNEKKKFVKLLTISND